MMVDKIAATDAHTVVIQLKFATSAFLPALADPYNWIYQKKILDKDPHWYEHNVMGSGPFVFEEFQTGQSIKGKRNPHYYHQELPYLDGFVGICAPKQAVQLDAIRADRAATEFRSSAIGLEYHSFEVALTKTPEGATALSSTQGEILRPGPFQSPLLGRLKDMKAGDIVLLDVHGRLSDIISRHVFWVEEFVPGPFRVLTNGMESKALIIPADAAGMLTPLVGGDYRFEFAIDRVRYRAQTADGNSNYRASQVVMVRL